MQETNNQVEIIGAVVTKLAVSHEVYGELFYNFVLKVTRLSETYDLINVTVSDRLLKITPIELASIIHIKGQFRSYNNYSNIGNRLMLTVFAKDIELINDENMFQNVNNVYLSGYICKQPIYRVTPFGREISDILLAVNRSYNKSDYIPCITWGRNAKFAAVLKTGSMVKIWGRVQSRNYQKKLDDQKVEEKTAYEVSVSKLESAEKSNRVEDEIG